MKRIIFALLSASLILLSCNKYETVKGDPLETKIYTLDNGLKVFMSVNKEQPRIQTYIAVRVGSKNDPSETTGLAHYLEHLMFKGSEQFGTSDYAAEKPLLDEIEQLFEEYRTLTDPAEREAFYHKIDSVSYEASKLAIPNEYDKLMSMIGADGTNAFTSDDETVYTEDIPSNQIDNWARIQADRFRHSVIRGFHTELETVYEEKNMSLTQDSRKIWEVVPQLLYPNHPYGQQTTLGTQEHLKNPSITNIKKFQSTYYVPNNIAICVSGDFDPDYMVKTIKKYFGDWEPVAPVPQIQCEPEEPINSPRERDVYGPEAERIAIAWRLPGAPDLKNSAIAEIAGSILYNGQAGLIDLDINQQQKALGAYAGPEIQPDYGAFVLLGNPKQGQTLEELRDLLLAEVAKLSSGDFDESLISATVNNIRLAKMRQLESNSARAMMYVDAFISGIPWKDASRELDRYSEVTKEDVVAWAQEFLGPESYAAVYKRKGEDTTIQKIVAPKITPIATNRDKQSEFLSEIQNTPVKPIEPVFVDFSKDMSRFSLADGVDVLYKENELNDIFRLSFVYNLGTEDDPALGFAMDYLSYLGTPTMSQAEIASKMYGLACDFRLNAGAHQTTINISGLGENMAEALTIVRDLTANAIPDEDILENLKSDELKARADNKLSQRGCFSALRAYAAYGPEYIKRTHLSNDGVKSITSEQLLSKVKDLVACGCEVLYYGPFTEAQVKAAVPFEGAREALPERFSVKQQTPQSQVVIAPFKANNVYYDQYSNRGEKYDPASEPVRTLFNEYFGGGMNTIVFQEMREARGLAYSATAYLRNPSSAEDTFSFDAFIATQNDKLPKAVEAFDEIINNMPESEAAFAIAKDAIDSRYRTQRTIGEDVLWAYRKCRRMGIPEPLDKAVFEALPSLTLADVKAAQEQWIKDRTYTYAILGDPSDVDMAFLKTLGPVRIITLEDIFGY
ncbi:MAG: insulinase family protein [Bacteroidales bacterium]|nr:insulinase family protein [Bacteroidales bacterium]